MVYKVRTGISWRDLPERYGPRQTVCTRFLRYALDGVFTRALHQIRARAEAKRLGYLSPIEFEEQHYANQATAEPVKLKPRQPALAG
jgi:transposase